MKKRNIYSLLIVAGGLFAACNPDNVDNVDFDFTVDNHAKEVFVGEPVTFSFSGNPDYIVFYSGEFENKYSCKDRTSVELESVNLTTTIKQQYYTGGQFIGQLMYAYISEDFDGKYTKESIAAATWTELTGEGENKMKYPTCKVTSTETVNSTIDISTYKNKPFHLAFRYKIPANAAATQSQPRVDVKPLFIEKTTSEGQKMEMRNVTQQFTFQYIQNIGQLTGNLSSDETGLLFQPTNSIGSELDIWAISQVMDLKAVSPDMGTPIKALSSKLSSYTYSYAKAGEYTVTFVGSNANMWNSKQIVKEMKIIVKEKPLN